MVDEEEGSGVNLGALKQSINLLKSGGVLGVVADRNLEQRGVKIKFFGHDTIVAAGVAKIALRTRVPCSHRHRPTSGQLPLLTYLGRTHRASKAPLPTRQMFALCSKKYLTASNVTSARTPSNGYYSLLC